MEVQKKNLQTFMTKMWYYFTFVFTIYSIFDLLSILIQFFCPFFCLFAVWFELRKSSAEGEPKICFICSKRFKNQSSLYNHLLYVCGAENKFKCSYCAYSCKRQRDLDVHIVHRHLKPKDAVGTHRCTQCDKTYHHRKHLLRHLRDECGVEPKFECPFCVYRSKHKIHMNEHIKRVHKATCDNQNLS